MNQLTQSKNTTILPVLIALMLGCFALTPQARAVCQEGCLANVNTVLGEDALLNATGGGNTAVGASALEANTTGFDNTAIGLGTLRANTTGDLNIAVGSFALEANTTGLSNTAIGYQALLQNTTGVGNTAIGRDALRGNTTGGSNTAMGYFALQNNTTGVGNVATGGFALSSNTTANSNTATGSFALWLNTGSSNTATGEEALSLNTTGHDNTANGVSALGHNSPGSHNTALGSGALNVNNSGNDNTACGFAALGSSSGSSNIGLGQRAGFNLTTGDNNIDIGNEGVAGESGVIRIGTKGTHRHTAIAGISGVTVAAGVGVIIDTRGRLGTVVSSARFKDQIKPMDKASEAILALKPVTFRYKHELDPDGIPQFGLVAEDVEKVNPALVARDDDGQPYTVRYEAVNAMLLNEFLKEHRTVQELKSAAAKQEANAAKQEATIARQQKQIEALTAGLQKVSAQVEMSRRAPQTVLNNQSGRVDMPELPELDLSEFQDVVEP
jgi:trimeric autotransporter adhesin